MVPSIVAIAAVLVIATLVLVRRVTIFDYQRGLKYTRGHLTRVLGAGEYWVFRPWTRVWAVDVRPRFVTVSGQEVLSADGVTVKISLAVKYEVADAERATSNVQDYQDALYLTLQVALRAIVGSMPIDEVLEKRTELGPRLTEMVAPSAEEIGLRLISVDVKDVMLPGEVKRLFNQIVKARKEGLAALEKARGETAALRHLANAAQMMEDHPSLLQLRALHQIGDASGNTVVIGLPNATVVPSRERQKGPAKPEDEAQ